MESSPSPLGHYADAVAALAAGLVVLAFVVVHTVAALAPLVTGTSGGLIESTQLDTAAIAVLGYVFGAMGRPSSSSASSSAPAAPAAPAPVVP